MSEQPDWPPRASAVDLPNDHVAFGSTGQKWRVQHGQWIRVKDRGDGWPRRMSLGHCTREELAIREVVQMVDRLGAHPILTDVASTLEVAREKLADWIDGGEPGGNTIAD